MLAPALDRLVVRDDGLAGTFFLPREGGPYPAVIVLGGSGGGIWEAPAALLAAHGFATLALAYFAYEHLPPQLNNIPLEYFEAALGWLQAHPRVNQDGLGVIGTSRGGELALLLGATFRQLKAAVAYVPSNVVWEGVGPDVPAGAPSWSYRGQPLPVMQERFLTSEMIQAVVQRKPIATTPLYYPALDDAAAVEDAAIPIEQSRAAILLISGQDDQMWPSARMAAMAVERLERHGYRYPVQHLSVSECRPLDRDRRFSPPRRPTGTSRSTGNYTPMAAPSQETPLRWRFMRAPTTLLEAVLVERVTVAVITRLYGELW